MRVIIDTNVLVSGLLSETSAPAKIVDAIIAGKIIPLMSKATFAELEEVLHRPRLQPYFRRAEITPYQLLSTLEIIALFVKPKPSDLPIRDEGDRHFLELAASRPTPDFIVTGDKDFSEERYHGVPVISASIFAQFLEVL